MQDMVRDTLIKQMAAVKLDEAHDLVKVKRKHCVDFYTFRGVQSPQLCLLFNTLQLFKSMGARAAVFTVRDQQLKEKEERKVIINPISSIEAGLT